MRSAGVAIRQPASSRQPATRPVRWTSWGVPKPMGQSKRSVACGSNLNDRPSASPARTPAKTMNTGAGNSPANDRPHKEEDGAFGQRGVVTGELRGARLVKEKNKT